MTPLCFLLVFLCEIRWVSPGQSLGVIQEGGVRVAAPGQEVRLNCSCQTEAVTFFCWYKQTLGGYPETVVIRMKHDQKAGAPTRDPGRFRVIAGGEGDTDNHLEIRDVRPSDSAVYFCGVLIFNAIEFGQGVFLHVKAPSPGSPPAPNPSPSVALLRGDAMNLSCTVHHGPCSDRRRLYWLRHGAAPPAVIHADEGGCTDASGGGASATGSCTVQLTVASVGHSDAGSYRCAVASCGEVVFGGAIDVTVSASRVLERALTAGLVAAGGASLVLVVVLFKLKRRACPVCKGGAPQRTSPAPQSAARPSEDAGSLHYAALSVNRKRERHHQRNDMETTCVYSGVNTNPQ